MARRLGVGVVDEDVDVFAAGEVADDLGVDPGDGLEFSGPVFGVVGPGDPGGGVGLPLGGHAVVLGAGVSVIVLCCGMVPPPPSKVRKVFHRCDLGLDLSGWLDRSRITALGVGGLSSIAA